ncbi:hypothetical protein FA13DRAFT_1184806 [Coprinellus micaceus]|uniref:Uncharacterized protein n=1 Tax=Coprinellus micaceus TaxID=71717 RepID=A0A4Y7RBP9_COPMI|nr:hypothetical protein FA13DRAFT_1184806 [Coprinellus micaceus]
MYSAGDELDGPPHGFEYGSHRRNTSGPSVLPTPPPSTSNTRSNSLRYPPPNRTFSGGVPYTPEPEGYEEGPAGVMDGYERNRLSRDAGKDMDEEWEPENPRRRLSSSASSGAKWNNPGSIRRTPGKPVPQPLNPSMFDRDNEESANIHYRERQLYLFFITLQSEGLR